MHGEGGVHAGKARNEVVLEGAYCVFCFIDAMEVGGDELEFDVGRFEMLFKCAGALVVKDLGLRRKTSIS